MSNTETTLSIRKSNGGTVYVTTSDAAANDANNVLNMRVTGFDARRDRLLAAGAPVGATPFENHDSLRAWLFARIGVSADAVRVTPKGAIVGD